ncbi:MAG: hypothetical protein KH111_12715 [Bacteroidales bacterium]|nr:hypothetical protein [Bacteroidales bacterium]
MKVFVKYCVLLLVAVIYLGQGIDSTRYLAKATGQERLISHEKDDFERLAMLTAMNGNALPVNTVQDVTNVQPTFRYLQKNNISVYLEEYKRVFTPYFRYIENDYLDSFALKQDVGYYVFALREIIV